MSILPTMSMSSAFVAHYAHRGILLRMNTERRDEKVPVLFTASELKVIDDWSFAHRIRSRGEAIRQLIALGLEAAGGDAKPVTYDVGPAQKVKA